MITVIEPEPFIKEAAKIMTSSEKIKLIDVVARNPEAGSIIPRTGGVRKIRIARERQGKSGGFRVVYYYYDKNHPVILFTVFGKGEKSNISDAEKNELYKIVKQIKKEWQS